MEYMSAVVVSLFLGWALERAQMIVCANNYGSPFNGFGCVEQVNKKNAAAPMAYRVLVPWLIAVVEKLFPKVRGKRIVVYQVIKVVLNGFAIWSVWQAWGFETALLTCFLLVLTFRFDYWDWTLEIAGISLAMTGNLTLAVVGVFLHGLSRDTAVLVGAAFFLKTGDIYASLILCSLAALIWVSLRAIIGERPLYCKRWMIFENIGLIKGIMEWDLFFHAEPVISTAITALTLAAAMFFPVGWVIPVIILIAGWTMGKADESRVFCAALPWAAAWLAGMV